MEAAGVTEGGAGSAARSVTAQDSLGDLGTSAALARLRAGSRSAEGGGAGGPIVSTAATPR